MSDKTIPKPVKKKNRLLLNYGIFKYIPNIMNILPNDVVIKHNNIANARTMILFLFNFYYYY